MPVAAAVLGGIGLFLLGMVLLTEGLKEAAGDALRRILSRFTAGVPGAAASGAAVTALVQSSSATVLATIGFVSAGLLAFPQAVGVVFGAALGTTSTGWLVAFLGLRYSVSAVAMPLVGVGALAHLLGRGRLASGGLAVAGFGLIFVGIDALQAGMEGLSGLVDLSRLDYGAGLGRAGLFLIGLGMTVVMQSSSAAVATTLAALHGGTIALEQAAVLVIGQNVGTAVTAALASIGASVPARRTALAHILFNLFTGALAFLALPLYLAGMRLAAASLAGAGEAGSIAFFHTAFNLVGVALVLPAVGPFSRLVMRLLPDPAPVPTRHLDASVANVAPVAVEAARRAALEVAALVLEAAREALAGGGSPGTRDGRLAAARGALEEIREFLRWVRSSPDAGDTHARHLSVLHATDHLERLTNALRFGPGAGAVARSGFVRREGARVAESLAAVVAGLEGRGEPVSPEELESLSERVAAARREARPRAMAETATGELEPEGALQELDVMRWVDRLAYHAWRVLAHLSGQGAAVPDRR